MDTKKRSIYKTISWHILHLIMVESIAYIVTGSVHIAALLASLELLWESAVFYLHERAWAKFGNRVE